MRRGIDRLAFGRVSSPGCDRRSSPIAGEGHAAERQFFDIAADDIVSKKPQMAG
jgi:hypothetical protein